MIMPTLMQSVRSSRPAAAYILAALLAATFFDVPAGATDCSKYPAVAIPSPSLPDSASWDQPRFYSTIQTADINGDGQQELAARAADGMHFWRFDPTTGGWTPLGSPGSPHLSDAAGWGAPQNYLTIHFAALTKGSSQTDLLARASDGIHVYRYDRASQLWQELGASAATRPFPDLAVRNDGTGTGWELAQYYSTIQLADIDGDGVPELIGRSASGLQVWRWDSTRNAWTGPTQTSLLTDANGYADRAFYTPIFFADLNADGKQKLIVRTESGLVAFQWDGGQFQVYSAGYGPFGGGYSLPRFYETMRVFVDANQQAWAVSLAYGSGGGGTGEGVVFQWDKAGKNWTNESVFQLPGGGWDATSQYFTLQAADIDGDGQMEILVRASDGLHAFHRSALTWTELPHVLYNFNDASGFNLPQSFATIQTATEKIVINKVTAPRALVLGRDPKGIQTYKYDGSAWSVVASGFPAWPNANQEAAYKYISTKIVSTTDNIRSAYTDVSSLAGTWTDRQTAVSGLKGQAPQDIPAADFEAVRQALQTELGYVAGVRAWFTNNQTVMTYIYTQAGVLLPTVTAGVQIADGSNSQASVVLEYLSLAFDVVSKILGVIPEAEAAAKVAEVLQTTMDVASAASASESGGSDAINAKVFEVGNTVEAQNAEFTTVNACQQESYLRDLNAMQSLSAAGGPWVKDTPTELADAETSGAKGLELWLYKSISPAAWQIWTCDPSNYWFNSNCPLPAFPTRYVWTHNQPSNGNGGTYSYVLMNEGHNNVPAPEVLHRIFDADQLGGNLHDMYLGWNGWQLPGAVRYCDDCGYDDPMPAYQQCKSGCPPPNTLGVTQPAVAKAASRPRAELNEPTTPVDVPPAPVTIVQASQDNSAQRAALENAVRALRDDVTAMVPEGPARDRLIAPLRETLRYLRMPNSTSLKSSAANMLRFFTLRAEIRVATPISVEASNRHLASAYSILGMFTESAVPQTPLVRLRH